MTDYATVPPRRRPQWRGERRAVMVRLPVSVAERLAAAAAASNLSLSETATQLIADGLDADAA